MKNSSVFPENAACRVQCAVAEYNLNRRWHAAMVA